MLYFYDLRLCWPTRQVNQNCHISSPIDFDPNINLFSLRSAFCRLTQLLSLRNLFVGKPCVID